LDVLFSFSSRAILLEFLRLVSDPDVDCIERVKDVAIFYEHIFLGERDNLLHEQKSTRIGNVEEPRLEAWANHAFLRLAVLSLSTN